MEYNYEDKEKMDKLQNSPEAKKQRDKKFLQLVLLCIPIIVGIVLFTTYCSLTPNYVQVYENEKVSSSESDTKVYTLDDEFKYVSTELTASDGVYTNSSNKTTLFKVDLAKLQKANSSYSKLALNVYFSAATSYGTCTSISSYPKLSFLVDRTSVGGTSVKKSGFTDMSVTEINIVDKSEFLINVSDFGSAVCADDYFLQFKNIRLKVLGV